MVDTGITVGCVVGIKDEPELDEPHKPYLVGLLQLVVVQTWRFMYIEVYVIINEAVASATTVYDV